MSDLAELTLIINIPITLGEAKALNIAEKIKSKFKSHDAEVNPIKIAAKRSGSVVGSYINLPDEIQNSNVIPFGSGRDDYSGGPMLLSEAFTNHFSTILTKDICDAIEQNFDQTGIVKLDLNNVIKYGNRILCTNPATHSIEASTVDRDLLEIALTRYKPRNGSIQHQLDTQLQVAFHSHDEDQNKVVVTNPHDYDPYYDGHYREGQEIPSKWVKHTDIMSLTSAADWGYYDKKDYGGDTRSENGYLLVTRIPIDIDDDSHGQPNGHGQPTLVTTEIREKHLKTLGESDSWGGALPSTVDENLGLDTVLYAQCVDPTHGDNPSHQNVIKATRVHKDYLNTALEDWSDLNLSIRKRLGYDLFDNDVLYGTSTEKCIMRTGIQKDQLYLALKDWPSAGISPELMSNGFREEPERNSLIRILGGVGWDETQKDFQQLQDKRILYGNDNQIQKCNITFENLDNALGQFPGELTKKCVLGGNSDAQIIATNITTETLNKAFKNCPGANNVHVLENNHVLVGYQKEIQQSYVTKQNLQQMFELLIASGLDTKTILRNEGDNDGNIVYIKGGVLRSTDDDSDDETGFSFHKMKDLLKEIPSNTSILKELKSIPAYTLDPSSSSHLKIKVTCARSDNSFAPKRTSLADEWRQSDHWNYYNDAGPVNVGKSKLNVVICRTKATVRELMTYFAGFRARIRDDGTNISQGEKSYATYPKLYEWTHPESQNINPEEVHSNCIRLKTHIVGAEVYELNGNDVQNTGYDGSKLVDSKGFSVGDVEFYIIVWGWNPNWVCGGISIETDNAEILPCEVHTGFGNGAFEVKKIRRLRNLSGNYISELIDITVHPTLCSAFWFQDDQANTRSDDKFAHIYDNFAQKSDLGSVKPTDVAPILGINAPVDWLMTRVNQVSLITRHLLLYLMCSAHGGMERFSFKNWIADMKTFANGQSSLAGRKDDERDFIWDDDPVVSADGSTGTNDTRMNFNTYISRYNNDAKEIWFKRGYIS